MKVITNLPIARTMQRWSKNLVKAIRKFSRRSYWALHTVVIVVLALFVVLSSRASDEVVTSVIPRTLDTETPEAIDEVASADIAANVARATNIPIKDSVVNQADSLATRVSFATVNNSYVAKPQVVSTDLRTKDDVRTYVTVAGDTVSSVAAKFNITSDTVRWANNVNGENLAVGVTLTIPPVSGVLHTVQNGDTIDGLAARYNANRDQLIFFNDIELSGLKPGERIVIPGGSVQSARRGAAPRTSYTSGFSYGTGPIYGGNGYSYGYCTYHAANRRAAAGNPIPRNLGNARTWYDNAARAGIPVGSTPRAGAVIWHYPGSNSGYLGHVAYVEKVNDDGSISVSDMNYPTWNRITYRTVPASEVGRYRYIY